MLFADGGDVWRTPSEQLDKCRSFKELKKAGFTPFYLGVVYHYAKVLDNLQQLFALELWQREKKTVVGTTIKFGRPIVLECGEEEPVLDVMETGLYGKFLNWLLTYQIIDRKERKFYVIRYFLAPILDPMALDMDGKRVYTSLPVFGLSGPRGWTAPAEHLLLPIAAPEAIRLELRPPEPEVQRMAQAALAIITEV